MEIPRTLTASLAVLTVCALICLPGCTGSDAVTDVTDVVIDSTVISSEGVAPVEGRTYEYDFASSRPDSVLSALWLDGIAVDVAWRPLHYLCEDVRGGRLTVQLTAPDAAMAEHDFTLGTGRLVCSLDLMRYRVSAGGG